jgi:hypothetical protein
MPLFIWIVIRAARAIAATLRLLFEIPALRQLPWPYIRRLPLRDRWFGFATLTLAFALLNVLVAAVAPPPALGRACATAALTTAGVGILASFLRSSSRRRRRPSAS